MGPVSFESLDGGDTRSEAVARAGRLSQAGIRVVSIVTEAPAASGKHDSRRYVLVIRSSDALRARDVLGAG